MDQSILVSERAGDGRRLIEALAAEGFDVPLAFWAKLAELKKWYLYLASPFRDGKNGRDTYRIVHDVLRKTPDLWIDSDEVRVLGMNDSLTKAALAIRRPRPYPRMTHVDGSWISDLEIDDAYIYPEPTPAPTA